MVVVAAHHCGGGGRGGAIRRREPPRPHLVLGRGSAACARHLPRGKGGGGGRAGVGHVRHVRLAAAAAELEVLGGGGQAAAILFDDDEGARPEGADEHEVGHGEQRRERRKGDEVGDDAHRRGHEGGDVGDCGHEHGSYGPPVCPPEARVERASRFLRRHPASLVPRVEKDEEVVAADAEDDVDPDDVHHTEEADVEEEAVDGESEGEGGEDLHGAQRAQEQRARVEADVAVDEGKGEDG